MNITKPKSRPAELEWPVCSFFAVYDGHGGNACADYLKDRLHILIVNHSSFPSDPAQAITSGCLAAERKFCDIADKKEPNHDTSGSCAIIVMMVGNECYIGNIGDSRAVMSASQGKQLFLLSRDHKPDDENERTRITKNGGQVY